MKIYILTSREKGTKEKWAPSLNSSYDGIRKINAFPDIDSAERCLELQRRLYGDSEFKLFTYENDELESSWFKIKKFF